MGASSSKKSVFCRPWFFDDFCRVGRREARRKLKRIASKKTSDEKEVKTHKTGSAKHDRTKHFQQMEGEQIFQAAQTYSKEVIDDLPAEVQDNIKINFITKKGMLEHDKESVVKKRNRQEDKQKSYKRKIHSVIEHQDDAKKMKVDNDETFVAKSTEQMKKEKLMDTALGITHWDKMPKKV